MLKIWDRIFYQECDAPRPWGLYFQDSAAPAKWFGKSLLWVKLSNSGDTLKFLIPSSSRKAWSGWINYSCKVTSQKMIEKEMGYRGSKSVICKSVAVKEQRVDGSWRNFILLRLRCILMGFERNYQVKILSNQIINRLRWYSSRAIFQNKNQYLIIHPWFFSGFTDAECSFVLSILKNNELRQAWVIRPRFEINLHQKDEVLLEQFKSYFCPGNINKSGSKASQFRVDSIKDLKVLMNHFDRYPLITQKFADYELFKQA